MPDPAQNEEQAISERAYFIWEREGRPEGRAQDHWNHATIEIAGETSGRDDGPIEDEEKVLTGRLDANIPAMLTKGVLGG